ncbi:hypothetical protein U0070_013919 [Myodes glareolus]|uniref:Uncharacterized protein n=1 Tax=Myodes glareolus TaxID=447135 RepID=A0AAW0I0D6_MYOGA
MSPFRCRLSHGRRMQDAVAATQVIALECPAAAGLQSPRESVIKGPWSLICKSSQQSQVTAVTLEASGS